MITRKLSIFILALLFLSLLLGACKGKEEKEELPRWYFGVEGAKAKVFSTFDYGKLKEVSMTVERTGEDGKELTEKMTGVKLKDVLNALGVSSYSSLSLTSKEGKTVQYLPDLAEDSETLLVFEINGKTLWDEVTETVQIISGKVPEDMWLWNLKTLTVNP